MPTLANEIPADPFDESTFHIVPTVMPAVVQPNRATGDLFGLQGVPSITVNALAIPIPLPYHQSTMVPQQPLATQTLNLAAQVQLASQVSQFTPMTQPAAQGAPSIPSVTHIVSPAVLQGQTGPLTMFVAMVAPIQQVTHTATAYNGQPNVAPTLQIYECPVSGYPPHSISPQVIFGNYSTVQIEKLYGTKTTGDILIILYNKGFPDFSLSTKTSIQNALKTYFNNPDLPIQAARPYPIGPATPPYQTPFVFYG
ncbi:uncharacterized protein ARMOST_19916 [Armillaria ostoyae]|uniref:Uncharacterized protein n=1 Tax=Armillaria ostoyae TaxID=47428 RepID=A0A284S5W1_ARMOS|nr:uncharacterized protein ARMOST_19916 [Armillaria ostoyae]